MLSGGVKLIPVRTPTGEFRVWTKRVGNNPRAKLLLLHGGPGATHEYFEAFDSYLPAAGIEYYYDQLGSAYSDQPDAPELWEVPRFVEEVEQVRRALALDRSSFFLLGHSWGGVLAIEYALEYQRWRAGCPRAATSSVQAAVIWRYMTISASSSFVDHAPRRMQNSGRERPMGRGCVSTLAACAVLFAALPAAIRAQGADRPDTIFEIGVPGGIRAALAVIDDRAVPDRSQFLLELIRRFNRAPFTAKDPSPPPPLLALLAHFDRASAQTADGAAVRETVPLPLSPQTWIKEVFGGRVTSESLVTAILQSRHASLLYYGLLALDDETREWLGTRPDLVAALASERAAAFLVAAPALRVEHGRMRLPGGDAADPVWMALVGRSVHEPAEFVRRVVEARDGRLAYFLSAIAQLTPSRVDYALNLDSADPAARVATARRLFAVFEHVAAGWHIDRHPFWRPALDPALLLSDLRVDDRERPMVPGSRRLWHTILDHSRRGHGNRTTDGDASRAADPPDFVWLCEHVFEGTFVEHRRPYAIVLFASRHGDAIAPEAEQDAVEAIAAAGRYPALTSVLERAGLTDLAAYARAARRASRLAEIEDHTRAVRALAQFQGALALTTRSALRGSLPPGSLPSLISSLSAIEVSSRGDYEGRLARWLDRQFIGEHAAESIEQRLMRRLAGSFTVDPAFVDWEGTRYRVDLSAAEAVRLAKVLEKGSLPYVSSARALVAVADALRERSAGRERLRAAADTFSRIAAATVADRAEPVEVGPAGREWTPERPEAVLGREIRRRHRGIAASLQRAARAADTTAGAEIADALIVLADDLLARGLMELAYAAAFGHPEATPISADEAAGRHDFNVRPSMVGDGSRAWRLPEADSGNGRGWHLTGSILGLDVRLARLSLTRTSSRPPPRKPSIDEADRTVFTEAVSLVQPPVLTEGARDAIAAALRRGRDRLAAIRSPADARALADEVALSPTRRTLLVWALAHDPARVPAALSLSELLWLGLERQPPGVQLDAWGVAAEPRLGCLCLRLIDRRPWEMLVGRWRSGILATGFPDLSLRLAELLAELEMPAALLGAVLASATADFIDHANSRDPDDRRGLLEFVQTLSPERVEEYLALLTTDGPLVPIGDATAAPQDVRARR